MTCLGDQVILYRLTMFLDVLRKAYYSPSFFPENFSDASLYGGGSDAVVTGVADSSPSAGRFGIGQPQKAGAYPDPLCPVLFRTVRTDSVPLRVLEGLYADAFGA